MMAFFSLFSLSFFSLFSFLQREVYRQLAKDGSNMFFIIKGLTRMDNMYQYSLDVFFRIFDQALRTPSNGASPVGRKSVEPLPR